MDLTPPSLDGLTRVPAMRAEGGVAEVGRTHRFRKLDVVRIDALLWDVLNEVIGVDNELLGSCVRPSWQCMRHNMCELSKNQFRILHGAR